MQRSPNDEIQENQILKEERFLFFHFESMTPFNLLTMSESTLVQHHKPERFRWLRLLEMFSFLRRREVGWVCQLIFTNQQTRNSKDWLTQAFTKSNACPSRLIKGRSKYSMDQYNRQGLAPRGYLDLPTMRSKETKFSNLKHSGFSFLFFWLPRNFWRWVTERLYSTINLLKGLGVCVYWKCSPSCEEGRWGEFVN
jgi:hypothetical protein